MLFDNDKYIGMLKKYSSVETDFHIEHDAEILYF